MWEENYDMEFYSMGGFEDFMLRRTEPAIKAHILYVAGEGKRNKRKGKHGVA